jgi:hypothetical protein
LYSLVVLCETNVLNLISQRLDTIYQIKPKHTTVFFYTLSRLFAEGFLAPAVLLSPLSFPHLQAAGAAALVLRQRANRWLDAAAGGISPSIRCAPSSNSPSLVWLPIRSGQRPSRALGEASGSFRVYPGISLPATARPDRLA